MYMPARLHFHIWVTCLTGAKCGLVVNSNGLACSAITVIALRHRVGVARHSRMQLGERGRWFFRGQSGRDSLLTREFPFVSLYTCIEIAGRRRSLSPQEGMGLNFRPRNLTKTALRIMINNLIKAWVRVSIWVAMSYKGNLAVSGPAEQYCHPGNYESTANCRRHKQQVRAVLCAITHTHELCRT
jgi:hypothetical protein